MFEIPVQNDQIQKWNIPLQKLKDEMVKTIQQFVFRAGGDYRTDCLFDTVITLNTGVCANSVDQDLHFVTNPPII